jgi:hypothetical protein
MAPKAAQVPIPAGVSRAPQPMLHAINFHDEPNGGREEIGDSRA